MTTQTALAAMYGNDGWAEVTDNDRDPTEPHDGDYHDWWTGAPPPWEGYEDMIADDPLLGVLLGAPHELVMPDGCSHVGVDQP